MHVCSLQCLLRAVAPVYLAHLLVQALSKGLGEAVGEGLRHDLVVVVVSLFVRLDDRLQTQPSSDSEHADVVLESGLLGRDKVGECLVRDVIHVNLRLLAQRAQGCDDLAVVIVQFNVVPDSSRRPEPEHGVGLELVVGDEVLEHGLRLVEGDLRLGAHVGVVEDLGVAAVRVLAAELPDSEERSPVNEGHELLERVVLDCLCAREGWWRGALSEVEHALARARLSQGHVPTLLLRGVVLLAHSLVELGRVLDQVIAQGGVQQVGHHRHRPRGVEDMDGGASLEARLDLHCSVHARRRGSANEEGQLDALALHLLGHRHHLVQRRRDEARQTNDVSLLLDGRLEDLVAGSHDAEVHHAVVVAAEDNTDDVLADVVHVALHSRQHNSSSRLGREVWVLLNHALLLLLHEGKQVRHSLLHHTGALDHLRQEHLARAKEIADDVHAGHEGALDDVERPRVVLAGLLSVNFNELVDALDEAVRQALVDRQ
mmetsp:Transcript_2679/g.6394  ORF Transcript_2679/g.6394 Transcript_2679/m.6394 type:complete len:486 (+) Transcript_2679:349-1806(+)